jgi:hypothetical protein
MEKGAGLAISPLTDTPIRIHFPEMGNDPFTRSSSVLKEGRLGKAFSGCLQGKTDWHASRN